MGYLQIAVSIILSAIIAVIADWLIKSFLPEIPKKRQIVISIIVFFLLVTILTVVNGPSINGNSVITPNNAFDSSIYRGLDKNCFDSNYWLPDYVQDLATNHGCWALPANFGFFARDGGILIAPPDGIKNIRGISTPVITDVRISFTLRINRLDNAFFSISLYEEDEVSGNSSGIGLICNPTYKYCDNNSSNIRIQDNQPHQVILDYTVPVFNLYIDGKLMQPDSGHFYSNNPRFTINIVADDPASHIEVIISNLRFENK